MLKTHDHMCWYIRWLSRLLVQDPSWRSEHISEQPVIRRACSSFTTKSSPPAPTSSAPVWHIFSGGAYRSALWSPQHISYRGLCSGGGGGSLWFYEFYVHCEKSTVVYGFMCFVVLVFPMLWFVYVCCVCVCVVYVSVCICRQVCHYKACHHAASTHGWPWPPVKVKFRLSRCHNLFVIIIIINIQYIYIYIYIYI